jgi:hypothetical protein
MMKRLSLSRPTQLLVTANIALVLFITAELLLPAQPRTANAAAAGDAAATLPEFSNTALATAPMTRLVDMKERPLFFPDRRMPQPKVEQSQSIPDRPLSLKLEGIAIAGGSRVAVLRNLNGNVLLQLTEGESHEGWTLDALTSTSATFSRDGEQGTELLLDPFSSGHRR